jgi:hypothetical protein
MELKRKPKVMPRSYSMRFEVRPDPASPLKVEVRIARTRAHMRGEMRRLDHSTDCDDAAGLCRTWSSKITGKPAIRPRQVVARIFLNAQDLRTRPGEIVSHECAHAAMGWARLRRANLSKMEGEEVMCYALGRLVAQVNRICYAARAFP